MSDIRDDARDGFEATFGYEATGVWSAPGAVTLIGDSAGLSISLAINHRTVVALGLRDDRHVRVASAWADELVEIDLGALSPDALGGWAAHPLGIAWTFGQHGADLAGVPGFDLFIESDVAVGAGLSASGALESAVALALNDSWRLGLDLQTLAGMVKRPATMLGNAVLSDCRPVPLDLAREGLVVLVIDTGVPSAPPRDVDEQRVLDVVAVLGSDGARAVGELIDDPARLTPQLDLALDTTRENGALGARMTGPGRGIALVDEGDLSRILVALDGAFAEHGASQPDTYVMTAGFGARREP
jgi:galactokinase